MYFSSSVERVAIQYPAKYFHQLKFARLSPSFSARILIFSNNISMHSAFLNIHKEKKRKHFHCYLPPNRPLLTS